MVTPTITMQLARNSFSLGKGSPLRELDRKFLEIAVAKRIEREYSKDEILGLYLNRIFWGHQIYNYNMTCMLMLNIIKLSYTVTSHVNKIMHVYFSNQNSGPHFAV